jgi:superfamily I DNA/RNA helicase
MEFDEHQLAIVESEVKLGKALIIKATAGSGKTRTVIGKVQRLAMEEVPSSSIVTTAFNNLAARELKDRFRSFKIPKPEVVSTLHSFGRYLLYKYFDLKPTVMTEWNSLVLMRDLLEKDFEGYKKSDLTPIAKELVEISNLLRCTRQYNKSKIANGTFVVHKYVDSDLDMKNPDICK